VGSLDGKVVIVTGAAGAQGGAAAALFAKSGAHVVLADMSKDRMDYVRDEIAREGGGSAIAYAADVAEPESWSRLVDGAVSNYGRLDGLANFAAVLSRPGIEETDVGAWDHTLRVNLTGAWLGMKAVIPAMRDAGGGSIVNIGSVDALVGRGGGAAYQASKGGLRLLSKSAATQYAAQRIRVNSVHPGPMRDRMTQIIGPRADASATAALEAKLTAQVPMGRLGQPLDIARAVRFLLSDDASFITGVDLPVDGGLTAQ
jgi:NAD(P)-dependent dehydrogenase (short-subunit alcohol dehydrogenase family)